MAFVAAKGSELAETATLLLALAREKGIDEWSIRVIHDGFDVPDDLLGIADKAVLGVVEPPVSEAPKRRGRPPGVKNKVVEEPAAEVEPEPEKTEPESE